MRSTPRTRWKIVSMLTVAGVALAACGGDGGGDGDSQAGTSSGGEQTALDRQLDELYEAARDAGQSTVTVYGPGANALQPLADAFTERFPDMFVDLVGLVGPDLMTRLGSEVASEQHTADVVYDSTNQGPFTAEHEDWFAPFELAVAADLPEWAVGPDNLYYSPWSTVFGLGYNSDRLDESEAPSSWAQMAEPEYEGRFGMTDPTISSAAAVAMAYALGDGQIDDAWMEQVAANDPVILVDPGRRSQAVLNGEVDAAIYPLGFMSVEVAAGAPVAFAADTAVTVPFSIGLLDGAPNAAAGQLFMAFMFTPEAQQINADIGQFGSMPGAPLPVEGVERSTALSAEEYAENLAHVTQTFSELLADD